MMKTDHPNWRRFAVILPAIVSAACSRPHPAQPPATRAEDRQQTIRVAAVSFVPTKFDLAANADRLEEAFRAARKGGAQIALAPEGVLEGYVVNEIIAGEARAEQMRAVAVPITDPVIQRFQRLAAELEMCLAFGFAERIESDVYNCALFIDHHGKISGRQHKMQLAEGYDTSWWFNRLGSHSRAIETPYGRCGFLICNDRWNPKLARILALDGAQFLLIPAYGSTSSSQDRTVLGRAQENRLPAVEANVGVTMIIDDGKVVATERKPTTITFGTITIRPSAGVAAQERDAAEQEFLTWREPEMRQRRERWLQRHSK